MHQPKLLLLDEPTGRIFFPTEKFPSFIKPVIEILLLTITSHTLRNIAVYKTFRISYLIILFFIALVSFFNGSLFYKRG
ncbi:MAG: hypothetical protein C0190_03115 [Thermodesulfobacterium geofontis]|uniref:Uncharacterized protein n=1 Tax=Thermodesulfobacterium geofontis TaxID=1295609 RepID=A0A2N7Q9N2_9BACT|nr:MAG: hypothetical protein C0190_03115 [Thermodesulfobacterium geofontis]PMP95024.1 MAG: hypothetical protein C0169_05840 [Thermodesulfobacterium geofontis]